MGYIFAIIIGLVAWFITKTFLAFVVVTLIIVMAVLIIKGIRISKCGSSNYNIYLLYRIANEVVNTVMTEYKKNCKDRSCKDPIFKTVSTFVNADNMVRNGSEIILTNLEGICYMMSWKRAGSNIMTIRLAQLLSYVNTALSKYPDKPFISVEDRRCVYEVLNIADLPIKYPELNL